MLPAPTTQHDPLIKTVYPTLTLYLEKISELFQTCSSDMAVRAVTFGKMWEQLALYTGSAARRLPSATWRVGGTGG